MIDAVKDGPPIGVFVMSVVGVNLSDAVLILTGLYTIIRIVLLLVDAYKKHFKL